MAGFFLFLAFADFIMQQNKVNTILDSDRVLVMQEGKVAEFDAPQNLLADENSLFSSLVRNAE
mgnify:CR=1 FL=1